MRTLFTRWLQSLIDWSYLHLSKQSSVYNRTEQKLIELNKEQHECITALRRQLRENQPHVPEFKGFRFLYYGIPEKGTYFLESAYMLNFARTRYNLCLCSAKTPAFYLVYALEEVIPEEDRLKFISIEEP